MAATLALGLCAVVPGVTQAGEPPGPQDDARVRGGRTVEKSPPAEQSPYVKITTELGVLVLYVAPQAGRALDQQSPYSLWWRDDTTEQIYLYGRRVFDRSGLVRALISLEAEFGPDPLELAQAIGAVSFGDSQRELAGDDPLWLPATRENVFAVMELPFPDGEDAEPIPLPQSSHRRVHCPPCMATLPDGKPSGRNFRNTSDDDRIAIELIAVPLPDLSLNDIIEIVILEVCGCGGTPDPCAGVVCDDENECTKDKCVDGECIVPVPPEPDGKKCTPDTDPCTDDICLSGECEHPATLTGPKCAPDEIPCTRDICVQGNCEHPLDRTGGDCKSDGNPCTKDTCEDGVCIHTVEHCDDSNVCTTDSCLPCVGCIHDHCCNDADPSTHDFCDQSASDPCSECTNAPRYPPPTAEESCIAAFGCRFSLTNPFGTLLPVNDDDDNGNGTPDYLEPGPVVGENDLVQVAVTFEDCMNTMCTGESVKFFWQAGSAENPSPFRFYKNFDKTGPVSPSPKKWESGFPPAMLYVEGVSPAFDAWVPSRLGVFCSDDTSKEQCISHSYGTKTVKLSSVLWQQRATSWNNFDGCTATAGNLDMERCPNNGGLRIFPGKQSPNDASSDLRRQVDLVATVEPPISGVQVYFRVYDVDDPFNQLHGPNGGLNTIQDVDVVDPNDGSAGPTGGDNRGHDNVTVGNYTELTNQYGQARLNVWVSMQPGDNIRAVATLRQDALSQSTQADADALSVTKKLHRNGNFSGWHKGAYWSQMLTVWRKLHVEMDSMGAGEDPSTLTGRNLDTTALEDIHQGPSGGHSWAEINAWSAQQNGRLEGGTLTVTGGGTYEIVDSVQDFGDDSVFVKGTITVDEDKLATATDDDAPFTPRAADTSLMNAKFKPAYIEIQLHPEESQFDIPFVANLSHSAVPVVNATAPGRNPTFVTAPNFWAVQIVSCYQSTTDVDHDPDRVYHFWSSNDNKDGEGARLGDTPPADPTIYDNVSVIFLESIRDWADWTQVIGHLFIQWPSEDAVVIERVTVVHEVGHVFLGPAHPLTGIMKVGASAPDLNFRAEDIMSIRSKDDIGQP